MLSVGFLLTGRVSLISTEQGTITSARSTDIAVEEVLVINLCSARKKPMTGRAIETKSSYNDSRQLE